MALTDGLKRSRRASVAASSSRQDKVLDAIACDSDSPPVPVGGQLKLALV